DAARDGTLTGPDLVGARAIAALGLDVIVSGGVAWLDDLRRAADAGLAGAIVGRALHERRFTLAEALACVAGWRSGPPRCPPPRAAGQSRSSRTAPSPISPTSRPTWLDGRGSSCSRARPSSMPLSPPWTDRDGLRRAIPSDSRSVTGRPGCEMREAGCEMRRL